MNCVPLFPLKRYIEILTLSTLQCELFGNTFFTEVVQLK